MGIDSEESMTRFSLRSQWNRNIVEYNFRQSIAISFLWKKKKSLGSLHKNQNRVFWRPRQTQNDSKKISFIYALMLLFFMYKISVSS